MKIQKLIPVVFLSLTLFTALESCKKCKDEPPRARITNNGTDKVSAQIQPLAGNTVNINNIDPGTSSAYSSYAAGQVTFTIKRNGTDYVEVDTLSNCMDYEIAISDANVITTTATERK